MNRWMTLIGLGLTAYAQAASNGPQVGATFRDCQECPEMVVIPAGSFDMGSSAEQESPIHRVTIAKAFAMGKTEVTQGQWRAIMGNNPSHFSGFFTSDCGSNCPAESVSWNDTQEYIRKLNAKTGKQYRLPSEAEWEYACRAGWHQEYCGSDNVDGVGWYEDNSGGTTHPVATKEANAWGLYDMTGNVWEWVEDSWHSNYLGAPVDGSAWQGRGSQRVLRGGSWVKEPEKVRSTDRLYDSTGLRYSDLGFRIARTLP